MPTDGLGTCHGTYGTRFSPPREGTGTFRLRRFFLWLTGGGPTSTSLSSTRPTSSNDGYRRGKMSSLSILTLFLRRSLKDPDP